jgi:hypothetical protein
MFEFSVNAGIIISGERIVIMYNSETSIFHTFKQCRRE